jgi:hypothetical protein
MILKISKSSQNDLKSDVVKSSIKSLNTLLFRKMKLPPPLPPPPPPYPTPLCRFNCGSALTATCSTAGRCGRPEQSSTAPYRWQECYRGRLNRSVEKIVALLKCALDSFISFYSGLHFLHLLRIYCRPLHEGYAKRGRKRRKDSGSQGYGNYWETGRGKYCTRIPHFPVNFALN